MKNKNRLKKYIKRKIEKLYYWAFPDRIHEHTAYYNTLNLTKTCNHRYNKLVCSVVFSNEMAAQLGKEKFDVFLRSEIISKMAPKLSEYINIYILRDLSNDNITTYRGEFEYIGRPQERGNYNEQ